MVAWLERSFTSSQTFKLTTLSTEPACDSQSGSSKTIFAAWSMPRLMSILFTQASRELPAADAPRAADGFIPAATACNQAHTLQRKPLSLPLTPCNLL